MDMKLVAADLLVVCINKEQPHDKNRYVVNTTATRHSAAKRKRKNAATAGTRSWSAANRTIRFPPPDVPGRASARRFVRPGMSVRRTRTGTIARNVGGRSSLSSERTVGKRGARLFDIVLLDRGWRACRLLLLHFESWSVMVLDRKRTGWQGG